MSYQVFFITYYFSNNIISFIIINPFEIVLDNIFLFAFLSETPSRGVLHTFIAGICLFHLSDIRMNANNGSYIQIL
jgi:hypothetical protein